MGEQYEAPMTEDEERRMPPRKKSGPRSYLAWTQDDGWCSACLEADRRVVLMGTKDRHVGLCRPCLDRLSATLSGGNEHGK